MQDFAKVDHKPTQSDGWAKKLQRTELKENISVELDGKSANVLR